MIVQLILANSQSIVDVQQNFHIIIIWAKLSMVKLTGIFKQIEEHTFSLDNCFLCGCFLNEKNRTEEHVIPKWLQREFKLWNQNMTLLNHTLISYRFLTIPCCFECNNIHLKPFEDKVLKAYNGGFEVFKTLDRETIFLWLGKIYYGILYREMFLNVDRANSSVGTITNPEYLKSLYSLILFLQGIRNKHRFQDFFPASIYIFKTQRSKIIEDQWDLIDFQHTPFISIRMGEIGLIAVLQDGEATKQFDNELDKHRNIDLHPLQFREISAKILYKAMLMNRIPKYLNTQNGESVETVMMSLQEGSSKPIFDNWDNDMYSKILSLFTELPIEICQPEKGKSYTWLMNENGISTFMDINVYK